MRHKLFIAAAAVLLVTLTLPIAKQQNFVRDVLAPTGMPFVAGYHHVRQSPFLNTHLEGCSRLEGCADFFLTPVQFLFGANTVTVDPATLAVEQRARFNYQSFFYPKMTLAAIFALPSLATGSALKAAAHYFNGQSNKHTALNAYYTSTSPQTSDALYTEMGLPRLFSEERACCQRFPRHEELSAQHATEIQALKEVVALLEEAKIAYWIDCGTALGAYRHGGIIPWDHDIDIAILEPDHQNVKNLLRKLDPKKYQVQDWSAYSLPKTFMKLYVRATRNCIDIYHHRIDPEAKTLQYIFTYADSPVPYCLKQEEMEQTDPVPIEWVFPLIRAQFEDFEVWVPKQLEAYLTRKYRGNIDPAKIWNPFTEAYEKVEGHPYWDTPHIVN